MENWQWFAVSNGSGEEKHVAQQLWIYFLEFNDIEIDNITFSLTMKPSIIPFVSKMQLEMRFFCLFHIKLKWSWIGYDEHEAVLLKIPFSILWELSCTLFEYISHYLFGLDVVHSNEKFHYHFRFRIRDYWRIIDICLVGAPAMKRTGTP